MKKNVWEEAPNKNYILNFLYLFYQENKTKKHIPKLEQEHQNDITNAERPNHFSSFGKYN
jgi:hypothetical protein